MSHSFLNASSFIPTYINKCLLLLKSREVDSVQSCGAFLRELTETRSLFCKISLTRTIASDYMYFHRGFKYITSVAVNIFSMDLPIG